MNYEPLLLSATMRITPGRVHALGVNAQTYRACIRSIDTSDGSTHFTQLPLTHTYSSCEIYPFVWDGILHFMYWWENAYVCIRRVHESGTTSDLVFDFIIRGRKIEYETQKYVAVQHDTCGSIHPMINVDSIGRLCFMLKTSQCEEYIIWIHLRETKVHIGSNQINVLEPGNIYIGRTELTPLAYDRNRDAYYSVRVVAGKEFACATRGNTDGVTIVIVTCDNRIVQTTSILRYASCDGRIMLGSLNGNMDCRIDDVSVTYHTHEEWPIYRGNNGYYVTGDLSICMYMDADSQHVLYWRDARSGDTYTMGLTAGNAAFGFYDMWISVWLADGLDE